MNLRTVALFSLLAILPAAHGQESRPRAFPDLKIIQKHRKDGTTQTEIKNSDPNQFIDVRPTGFGLQVGGSAKKRLVLEAMKTAPPAARRIELRDSKTAVLTGTLWELFPGSRVFVTARHVLQGVSRESVDQAFRAFAEPLESSQFSFIGFAEFDAIVAVPTADEAAYFKPGRGKAGAFTPGTRIQKDLKARSQSFTDAVGSVGDEAGIQAEETRVAGWQPVAGVDRKYLYLAHSERPLTPGSSGALVYLAPVDLARELAPADWRPGGIVECVTPERTTRWRKVKIPSQLRVIPLVTLSKAKARVENLANVLSETAPSSPDCGGVDRRGGGG